MADNVSDISDFSDSSDEAKKVVEVVEEAIEEIDKPAYSDEDLETLVGFIRNMVFLYDYDEADFGEEVAEVVKLWLTDVNSPLLFVFYEGDNLSASLAFPTYNFNDLMYFMREPDQLFNVIERFHDDIMFGTLHNDIEGSLLVLLEQVYGPLILSNTEWSENVKGHVLSGYNAFMTYLTDIHYKLSGFTLVYIPREGSNMDVHEVVLNRTIIKRLEAVVIDWTSQIRSTINDTQHSVPDELICPSHEHDFWMYRHEVLSAIQSQFRNDNVQHIMKLLDLAQSFYTKPLRDVLDDLSKEIEIAESNIPFLKLLVEPCCAIRSLDSEDDLCSQLIYVMLIIRFIGSNSPHLHRDEYITKLYQYLSNEIVSCCMQSIDIDKILSGAPDYGIEICDLKINCCESYKIIFDDMLQYFQHDITWKLDYAAIFNRINAFMQRLYDTLEICRAMRIFGKYGDSNSYKNYRFSCNNARLYEEKCRHVEATFKTGIERIQSISGSILDINNKEWYKYIADFREILKNLDDIIENLLSNIFLAAENLEEKIDVLITLLNFYRRDSIKESFMRKIGEIWSIFKAELTTLSKEISSGINYYPRILSKNCGQYTMLKIKFERINRLRDLLERCRFFPSYAESDEILSLFESCEKQVKAALKGFNDAWIKSISSDYTSWFHRNLICRSQIRPGLLECYVERRMLTIFEEAHFFKVLGATVPSVIDMEKNDGVKLTFDNVIRIILYFNGVVSSISEKERLFFKPMIQQTERKLESLRGKLTWDDDLTEYIDNFVVNVKELLDIIQLYKKETIRISQWIETIYNLLLFQLDQKHSRQLTDFINDIKDQKKTSISELVRVYLEISKHIFCIYENLGSNIRKMSESWTQYVQKIDRLLKAAVFKSSLNTMENIKNALDQETSNPILCIELILDKHGITYQPKLESVETILKRLPDEVTSTIKIIPSMCQRFQIDSDEIFYDDFLQNETFKSIEATIHASISSIIEELCIFKEKWNLFRPFWSVNRKQFIDKFKLSSMTSEAFHKNIEKFEELLNQLTTQHDLTTCRCIEVDAQKLKYAITSHINDWQTKYIEYLKCVSYGRIIDFNNKLSRNMEALSIEPKEVQHLKDLEAAYQSCSDDIPLMIEEIHTIVKYFNVLDKYVTDILPEASNLRQNIHSIWQRYMDYMGQVREQIENYQNQFKLSMTNDVANLKVNALEMLKMLDIEMPISDDLSPEEAFPAIDKLLEQLNELEEEERKIKENMMLLGIEYKPLDVIIEIRRKLENMKHIWEFVQQWLSAKDKTFCEKYETIWGEDFYRISESLMRNVNNLQETLLDDINYPIFCTTQNEVDTFCITVSILINMKSSNLRERHWKSIESFTKVESLSTEDLLFGEMVSHEFYQYKDKFVQLCHTAQKEYENEVELEALHSLAQSICYNVQKTTESVYHIMDAEKSFSLIKTCIVMINRLQQSVFSKPFNEVINYWEETLNFMNELLELLLSIEEQFGVLHEMHRVTKSSEHMSKFNAAFESSRENWITLMRLISQSQLQTDICPKGSHFLQGVESVRKHFEGLNQYLLQLMEQQRDSCNRFYLVPDRLLIKLMAFPTNLHHLQHSFAYTFENIVSIAYRQPNLPEKYSCYEITGITTKDDENISFMRPILLKNNSTMAAVTNEIEQLTRDTLKMTLRKSVCHLKQYYFKRIESGWMHQTPYQVSSKSAQIENTLLIRNALVQSNLLGKIKPMKMLRTLHNKLINELAAASSHTRDNPWTQRKVENLLLIELNTRDTIENLLNAKVTSLTDFEWLSQIRSYWNDDTGTCNVAQVNSVFSYGYDCKACIDPIFITPHTNRTLMAITHAITSKYVPYLTGYDGDSLLKQFSMEIATFLVVLRCDTSWISKHVAKYVEGMIKLKAWLCFSAIERMPIQIMTMVNKSVRDALLGSKEHEVLDLKKPKDVTQFQLFVTTPGQAQPLPELERLIMRPIEAVFPDRDIIVENLLFCSGMKRYKTLAFLLKQFVKHLQLYLPQQLHLWTFERIRKVASRANILHDTRNHTDIEAMVNALQDEFLSCLSEDEEQLFIQSCSTIFHIKPCTPKSVEDEDSDNDLKTTLQSLKLTPSEYLKTKSNELLSILATDSPIMLVGEICGGKSELLNTVSHMLSCKATPFKHYYINPVALKSPIDENSSHRQWLDNILTAILKSSTHKQKLIIFDCPLQDFWIQQLTSIKEYVTHDLRKWSIEANNVKIIIETPNLSEATPRTITNFAIVNVDNKNLTWKQSFCSWITALDTLNTETKELVQNLADNYFDNFLRFRHECLSSGLQYTEISVVQTLCSLFEQILQRWIREKTQPTNEQLDGSIEKLFFFSCIWAIGGFMDEINRAKFDVFFREQIADTTSSLPLKGNIFQYFIEITGSTSNWTQWKVYEIEKFVNNENLSFVYTSENIPYHFVADVLRQGNKPVLITSPTVTGKSAILKNLVNYKDEDSHTVVCHSTLNVCSSARSLERILEQNTMKISTEIVYPKNRKNLVWFVDDLHKIVDHRMDTMEFLRHLLEHQHWYGTDYPQYLKQTRIVAAMRNIFPMHSHTSSTWRLLNKFHIIQQNSCSDENAVIIFGKRMKTATDTNVNRKITDQLAPATVELINLLSKHLPPTPNKLRYQFSLKTIARIMNMFSFLSVDTNLADLNSILRLWIHECYRETWDRLDQSDYKLFYEIFNDTISRYFEVTLHGICPANQSPLFSDVTGQNLVYKDVAPVRQMIDCVEKKITESDRIIVYREAVEHMSKISRILRIEGEHMALVGEPGSGRETVCRLSTIMTNTSLHRLDVKMDHTEKNVNEEFTKLFECCLKNRTLCIVNITQAEKVNSNILSILNSIIVNGTSTGCHLSTQYNNGHDDNSEWQLIKQNLHFIVFASADQYQYWKLHHAYPAMMTTMTTNCMHQLSEESLVEISKKYLFKLVTFDVPILSPAIERSDNGTTRQRKRESLIQSTEEKLFLAVSEAISRFHTIMSSESAAGKFSLPFSWYFENLHTFKRVLDWRRQKLCFEYKKFYNGIQQIVEATNNVTTLQEQLEKQQEQIAIYQAELEAFINDIQIQTEEAALQSQEIAIKREKISEEEVICKQLASAAEADLAKAMPALNAAIAALDSLNKKDMNEIKSYSRPPVKVELVLNAVMILLGKEPTWVEAKRQLGEQKFLDTLRNFDRNNMSEKTLKTIGGYVRNPDLEPNKVGIVSKAAKSLIIWVRAIENYGKVYKYVGPKIRKKEDAERTLLEKQKSLQEAEQKLAELAEHLSVLRMEYEAKMKSKLELEETARQMFLKLERARALVDGLSSEKIRWTETAKTLKKEYSCVIGDTLLAASYLVYFGAMSPAIRESAKSQWKIDLETLEVLYTDNFNIFEFFYSTDTLYTWQSYGLPNDNLTVENATIALNSTIRISVIVDPQGEIQRWLINLYNETGLLQYDIHDDIPESSIEAAIHEERPVLISNIQTESLHFFYDLEKVYFRTRRQKLTQNEKPILIATTCENIFYNGPLKKISNKINFILGKSGLEIKLLATVVEHENPTLEKRKEDLMKKIISDKHALLQLEENILRLLNQDVPLLENEELYGTLNISKQTAETINESLMHAESTRRDIESSREIYRPCASKASLLFFILEDLKKICLLYCFSLEWYFDLFKTSLQKSSKSQVIEERKKRINDFHTFNTFRNVCFAMGPTDQKIFAFYLCVRLLIDMDEISTRELNFFLHGPERIDRQEQAENPDTTWINPESWDNITELDKLPGFRGIIQSFEEDTDSWKLWYISTYPEAEKLPGNWERNLTVFRKHIIARSLRLDRLESCANKLVERYLGTKYIANSTNTLSDILKDSVSNVPYLLISNKYCNPLPDLQILANSCSKKSTKILQLLNMNTETIDSVVSHLKKCVRLEKWLFIQDCHRSKNLLSQFHHIMDYLQTIDIDSNFRLWISIDENVERIPIHLLQNCVKIKSSPPMSIKQNMKSIYEQIGDEKIKKISKSKFYMQHKKLLLSMAFFHSLLIGRNKFQQLGWSKQYWFSALDFKLTETLLAYGFNELMDPKHGKLTKDQLINNVKSITNDGDSLGSELCSFVRNVILEVGYGTQITNKWDRRVYDSYCGNIFQDSIMKSSQCSLVPNDVSYDIPRDGNHTTYLNFIMKQLPNDDGTNVFGQNENANIKYLESQSIYILQMLRKMHTHPPDTEKEEGEKDGTIEVNKVKQTVMELLTILPVCLDYDNAARIVGTNRTPVDDCLLNEIRSYNDIVELTRRNLTQIINSLSGERSLDEACLDFLTQIQQNRVPQSWLRYPTEKHLSDWMIDLRQRVEYFRRWTETGQLSIDVVLGKLLKPNIFLYSILLMHADAYNIPVTELTWMITVFPTMKPVTRMALKNGFIARGLYLNNGSWDLEKQCLKLPRILETICPMPPIAFKPIKKAPSSGESKQYICPCYYSITQTDEEFITSLNLDCGAIDNDVWTKMKTSLFLNN